MKPVTLTCVAAAAVVLAAGGSFLARAGDLNPPPGPVSPTMVTLDDILAAVQGTGTTGGLDITYVMQMPGIDGEIDGVPPFPNDSIPVNAYSFAGSINFGGGGGAGALSFGGLGVTLPTDSSTPQIFLRLAQGFTFSEVTLQGYVLNQQSGALRLFQEITLIGANIETMNAASDAGSLGLQDLNFVTQRLCLRQAPVSPTGDVGSFQESCWNFATNSSCSCP